MTSTNEGKNVKSNQSSSSKGKSYYIELYKSLDGRLSGEGDLQERTQHLCEAWRRIHSLCLHSAPSTHPHLLSWLQRHTARTILQTEWQKPESKAHHGKLSEAIQSFIEESQKAIAAKNGAGPSWECQLLQRAEWFKNILTNPWGHPILRLLSNPTGERPSDNEVLEWLKEERGVMFVTRLRQLATAKTCVDIASALVAAVMDRVRASAGDSEESPATSVKKEPSFGDILKTEAGFTVDVWELLIDLEFVLLFKGENSSRCIDLAKQTPLRTGYQLVERLHSRLEMSPRDKKLWKNAKEVATLIAQVVIARCMVIPVCAGVTRSALYCCTRSLVKLLPAARLPTAASALAAPAATARHLHTLAAAVDAQSNNDMKPFVCELYVRAITTGMNELERLKIQVEKEPEARSAEQTLSSWFMQLGTLLSTSPRLHYECALTAFSVHPSPAMYERILSAPELPPLATTTDNNESKSEANSEFGSWATDSRAKTNFVKTSETLNIKQIQYNTNVLSTAVLSEGEAIGLGAELCQDLAVLLSGPRHKTLSWDMNRDTLLDNCKTYMQRTNGGTRALTTELKYLNLDPRSFQHLPEEVDDEDNIYYGIEKGYEHLVEFQEAEHIWHNAFDYSETEDTFSSSSFDEVTSSVRRKKKKLKKGKKFSDTEIDPLSTVGDEQQYEKKKERPHSKERSKDISQIKESEHSKEDHEQTKVVADKKLQKKERKERKKRDKVQTVNESKVGSLSRLVGMKVTRADIPPTQVEKQVTKSGEHVNFTSQRKLSIASLNSDGSDTNVVFDGLYSMDEIKSPEKNLHCYEQYNKSTSQPFTEVSEKVEINDKLLSQKTNSRKVPNIVNTPHEAHILTSQNTTHSIPDSKLGTKIHYEKQFSEDVKQNIKKLLQFRKLKYDFNTQPKVVNELHSSGERLCSDKNNTTSHEKSLLTKNVWGDCSIHRKSTSNASKHSINTNKCEQLSSMKSERSNAFAHPTERSYVGAVVTGLARYTNTFNEQNTKEKEIETQSLLNTESDNMCKLSSKKILNKKSCVGEKEALVRNISNEIPTNGSSDTNSTFEVFLKELKETINAGAIKDKSEMQNTLQKDTKSVNKVLPTSNNLKAHPAFTPQCAKPLVQQKKADVPNTFARLNYMHKNKNSDVRHKPESCQTKQTKKQTSEFEHPTSDVKLNKFNYLQTKSDLTISKIANTSQYVKPKGQATKQKDVSKEHPCLTNMLQTKTNKTNTVTTKNQINKKNTNDSYSNKYQEQIIKTEPPRYSFLAEKDQKELLLLLRQQSYLNKTTSGPKPEPKPEQTVQFSPFCNTEINSNTYPSLNLADSKKLTHSEPYKEKSFKNFVSTNKSSLSRIDQEKPLDIPTSIKKVAQFSNSLKAHTSTAKKARQQSEAKIAKKDISIYKHSSVNTSKKQDWESVMDALLKHKTPSRGPNALDIALNRDSFEKRLKDNISIQNLGLLNTESEKAEVNKNDEKCLKDPLSNSSTPILSKLVQTNLTKSAHKPTIKQKSNVDYLPKSITVDVSKKEVAYSDNYDPFISGIPNSDYDLLEELMDDDLRKEIGELFSDEDSYSAAVLSMRKENESRFEAKAETMATPLQKNVYDHSLRPARVPEIQDVCSKGMKHDNSQTTEALRKAAHLASLHNTKLPSCSEAQSFGNDCNFKTLNVTTNCKVNKPAVLSHTKVAKVPKKSVNQTLTEYNIVRKCKNKILGNNSYNTSRGTNVNTKKLNTETAQTQCSNNSFRIKNQNINLNCINEVSSNMTPLQNVVVIAPKIVYDPYSAVQVERTPNTSLSNIDPNTYLAINTNIALLQSTQFASPVVTPVIIGNASTFSTPQRNTQKNQDISSSVNSEQPNITSSSKSAISEIKQTASPTKGYETVNNDILKTIPDLTVKENCQDNEKHNAVSVTSKIDSVINRERKILSQVQENHNLSYGKIDIRSTTTFNQIIEGAGDIITPKESERLKEKRLAIISRKVSHHSHISPIPLPYTPLKIIENKLTSFDVSTINDQSSQRNMDVETKLVSEEVLFPRDHSKSCSDTTSKVLCQKEKFRNRMTVPNLVNAKIAEKNADNNKCTILPCRPIFLRSTYKINDEYQLQEQNKIRSKSKLDSSFKKDNNDLDKELANNAKKINTYTTELSAQEQNNFIGDAHEENDIDNTHNIESVNINAKKSAVNILEAESFITHKNSMESTIDCQFIDIEDELISSVIPKINRSSRDLEASKDIAMIIESSTNNEDKDFFLNMPQGDLSSKLDQDGKLNIHKEDLNLKSNLIVHVPIKDYNNYNDDNNDEWRNNTTGQNSVDINVINIECSKTEIGVKNKKNIKNKLITNYLPKTPIWKKHSVNDDINMKGADKVMIDEMTPNRTKNLLNKTFRIKLPNGKHVKATISGTNNYDVNNVLAHPELKALLLNNSYKSERCTLNIKKFPGANDCKIFVETSHTVMEEKKGIENTQKMETINLISDEEDNHGQGVNKKHNLFLMASLCKEDLEKHQKKLSKNCLVSLTRYTTEQLFALLEKNSVTETTESEKSCNLKFPMHAELDNTGEYDKDLHSFSNEHIPNGGTQIEKCDTHNVNNNSCFLPSEENNKEPRVCKLKDLSLKTLLLDDHCDKKTISIKKDDEIFFDSVNKQKPSNFQCYLRLTRCDSLVKKYEKLKALKQECFVELVRCDEIYNENLNKNISSISKNENAVEISVQSINDSGMESENIHFNHLESEEIFLPDLESRLTRSESCSILNNFSLYSNFMDLTYRDLNSDNYCSNTIGNDNEKIPLFITCDAEWSMTKRQIFLKTADCVHSDKDSSQFENENYADVSTVCKSDSECFPLGECKYIKEFDINNTKDAESIIEVPSLKKLVLKLFENNMLIHTTTLSNTNLLIMQQTTQFLKRKNICNENISSTSCKMLKVDCDIPSEEGSFRKDNENKSNDDFKAKTDNTIIKTSDADNKCLLTSSSKHEKNDEKCATLANYTKQFCDVLCVPERMQQLDLKFEKICPNIIYINETSNIKNNVRKIQESSQDNPLIIKTFEMNNTFETQDLNDKIVNIHHDAIRTENESKCEEVSLSEDKISTNLNKNYLNQTFKGQSSEIASCESIENNDAKEKQVINRLNTSQFTDKTSMINVNQSKMIVTDEKMNIRTLDKKFISNIPNVSKAITVNLDHDYEKTIIESDLKNLEDIITSKIKLNTIVEKSDSQNIENGIDIDKNDIEKEEDTSYDVVHNITLIYNNNSEVMLKGIEFEDPIAGTCYMFPLETNTVFSEEINENANFSNHDIETQMTSIFSENGDDTTDKENFSIIMPKKTYSRIGKLSNENYFEKLGSRGIKRKSDCQDFKMYKKRHRKGKNIDYFKNSSRVTRDFTYSKEFKRLCDYYNTLKFSYSRPFHKEYIDVTNMMKCWPVQNTLFVPSDEPVYNLFEDNYELKCFPDPTKQTLVEELSSKYNDIQSESQESIETNFNMGFGEESDRVIQNIENKDDCPKFSAATLSDVKQSQPFLLSENYENSKDNNEMSNFNSIKDQKEKLKQYITYIQLRDKVRSYFKKTTLELKYNWIMDNFKENDLKWKLNGKYDSINNPFDFYFQDFIDPPPLETIVQVVQVGQLPVSAAAQNPVSCDPRVTHVSDASPPQCSMENSLNDDSQSAIKTEYTELTTAALTLPLVAEYEHHEEKIKIESEETTYIFNNEETTSFENEFITKIEPKEEKCEADDDTNLNLEGKDTQLIINKQIGNSEIPFDANVNNEPLESEPPSNLLLGPTNEQNSINEKTDQIAHAMNAAGIIPTTESNTIPNLVNILTSNDNKNVVNTTSDPEEDFEKTSSINALALQQALAQILPPPLNQTNNLESDQKSQDISVPQQVLHIVQSKNTNGNQITLVESGLIDNSQQSVVSTTSATPVLHIVQNKCPSPTANSDETSSQHPNSFGGFSLVDTGLQQGANQLLHIVNTGNQKGNNGNQIIKRVNLLTNLTNVQGSNEQKMLQFVCKSADGKAIQLNAPHQRSMVLRLQPIETQNLQNSPLKDDDHSPIPITTQQEPSEEAEAIITQQEIKSRSVYEENYAKFIQNTTNQQSSPESTTSLPKFNQAFGKAVFQDGTEKQNELNSNSSHLSTVNSENSECEISDNVMNLEHIGQINSPPLLIRKSPQSSHAQPDLVQQIKQTITPMNIQTMHGGVIYTRQIPVNIGGGQTINLITVPTTELIDESNQKQSDIKFVNQCDIEPSIIKIVPPNQSTPNNELSHEEGNNARTNGENGQNTQTQPILTQMRIKLPMLSKTPQMVTGARVVRPSFFQIQRNVIGGTNQPVYQQLVLTAAPPLGQQTIRLPQAQMSRQVKVPSESSESQMSSSTLEQLREFDMVLEQVKERSTVHPNTNTNNSISNHHTSSSPDATDGASTGSTATESTQVLYSMTSNQQFNVAYVNKKSTVTTPATSTFVRSPDSSGINETPTTSTQAQLPQTVTTAATPSETPPVQQNPPKPKITSRSRSRPKASSNPPNTLKLNNVPPKTSSQKPLEDEQTTQRILYILAEYKEQVENSPDKDKPAPRRRTNLPTPGSSKRRRGHLRRPGARDISPVHGDDTCRTMGSEDSSCGTSQGDCNETCLDMHSPQGSPRKTVRKSTFEHETPPPQPRPPPQRNVIVADGQTITVARGATGKPTTAVLMPANYILPVSVVKGGQQIAIVTNRGPKLLTVTGGEGGTTNALLLQRLIGPAGLKPVLTRPGVRHVRLPTAALHNLQAFNLATATAVQPPDSTASPAPVSNPPDLVETKPSASPWPERETQEVIKPVRASSPDGSEPWNVPTSADVHDYSYEETVRTGNLDRTVLEPIPDRYSPDMEAQRIFDKMFDVDSKKSYNVDSRDESSRCAYDIDVSECDDKCYHQVVQKNISSQRQHRLTHVSAAALRHKYAILEHELRLQKSLSEECEDLGVDSPSASELFPEAELLFSGSPAHEHTQEHTAHRTHTPQPTILSQGVVPRPDIDDQIATDHLLQRNDIHDDNNDLDVNLGLDDVGIVTVTENGATITLDQEEFARSHPNTTFHSEEPIDDGEMQPYTISGIKGPHITSTIFHANRAPATVLMGPQTTVISQATHDNPTIQHNIKYTHIENIINTPSTHQNNLNLASVLVKDDGLTRFDSILTDSREIHLSNTASAIVHSSHNATQVIRRVCYDDDKRDARYLMDEQEAQDALLAGDDTKIMTEDSSRDATLESIAGDADDYRSSPERHADLYWESNSTSERSESRRPLDYSSDSDKCCKSPSYDETNSTDSSGLGAHMRLDSVIKDARGLDRSGSADGSSADDTHPPLRTYPPKRLYHALDGDAGRSLTGKTRAGERSPDSLEVRRRASGRGVVKRCCQCCNGSPIPPRAKKPRQRKPTLDFTTQ